MHSLPFLLAALGESHAFTAVSACSSRRESCIYFDLSSLIHLCSALCSECEYSLEYHLKWAIRKRSLQEVIQWHPAITNQIIRFSIISRGEYKNRAF